MAINDKLLAELAKGQPYSNLQYAKRLPANNRMRKRHWFLGSLVILTGSWITHTTTANIVQESPVSNLAEQTQVKASDISTVAAAVKDNFDMETMATVSGSRLSATAPIATQLSDANQIKPESEEQLSSRPYKIKKGESLGAIFRKQGLDLAIPHYVSKHAVANQLTSIRAGKTLDFKFNTANELREIHYPVSALQKLVVNIEGVNVERAEVLDLTFETQQRTVSAEINSSLYLAAQSAGLSNNLIMEMVRIFGWDIDFVQDIRDGDDFHIVFEEYHKDGSKLSDGHILAAEFTTQGQTHRAIRFEDKDGVASYFNAEGESMLGTFLRSPVEFSRISSRFGKRKHPISKKWKAHKGVDYAASRGTPIRATADGKVTLAGRKGGYGNTVILRHAGRFSTLYAHMTGFAKGIKSGSRVKQGQTIGYVGSTGMSTGPHLHYEFRVDGVHRNPLTYKTPKASSVSEDRIPEFRLLATALINQLDSVKQSYQIAKAEAKTKKI